MKAIIIEDEELIARELKRKLREIKADVEVAGVIPSLKVARRWLMENPEPDIWFMDIQLSDGVSFKLFDEFSLNAPVIFTTAYDEYAIKAFKVNGIDYLLKPVEDDELRKAIEKGSAIVASRQAYPSVVMDFLQGLQSRQPVNDVRYKQKFIVHARNQWHPVNTTDIAAFERDGLIYIHTFSGERYILSFESMEDIDELIDPSCFYRANRQWIIHVETIKAVKSLSNFKLNVSLKFPAGRNIDISREKAPAFRKWLDR